MDAFQYVGIFSSLEGGFHWDENNLTGLWTVYIKLRIKSKVRHQLICLSFISFLNVSILMIFE